MCVGGLGRAASPGAGTACHGGLLVGTGKEEAGVVLSDWEDGKETTHARHTRDAASIYGTTCYVPESVSTVFREHAHMQA